MSANRCAYLQPHAEILDLSGHCTNIDVSASPAALVSKRFELPGGSIRRWSTRHSTAFVEGGSIRQDAFKKVRINFCCSGCWVDEAHPFKARSQRAEG